MNNTPYYTGDPVTLKFSVRQKGVQGIKVTSAMASLYGPQGEIFIDAPAEIDGDDVIRLEIGGGVTDTAGDYRAEFTVGISPNLIRSHIIKFRILQREPIFSDEIDHDLMPVDEEASEYEISGAIGNAIRLLRRAGHDIAEAERISNDLAQKMTNKRLD